MRARLVEYNLTVDCSSFVAQVLLAAGKSDAVKGWSGNYLGGPTVQPEDLRPGDVMVRRKVTDAAGETTPGHVRIVASVRPAGSAIEFVTHESTAHFDVTRKVAGEGGTAQAPDLWGSVARVVWRAQREGSRVVLYRSTTGTEGSFARYTGDDELKRIPGLHTPSPAGG
jgi:hypothetical protein